jgi:kynurenine formamidase
MSLRTIKPIFVAALFAAAISLAVGAQVRRRAAPGGGLLERALRGEARIIDLTHRLGPSAPTFSGARDSFRYDKLAEVDRDGYTLGAFQVPEHFGTHVDAPGHFLKGRKTVDRIEPERLLAPAAVIDVRSKVESNPDYQLSAADLKQWERGGPIPDGAIVLLLTGWGGRYTDPDRYRNQDASGVLHFPGFSVEAIDYLIKQRKVVGLGIDTLSIDYGPSKDFAGHKLSHGGGLYHIENMAGLEKLPARGAVVFVGPLPVENGSGSPARVLAVAP